MLIVENKLLNYLQKLQNLSKNKKKLLMSQRPYINQLSLSWWETVNRTLAIKIQEKAPDKTHKGTLS